MWNFTFEEGDAKNYGNDTETKNYGNDTEIKNYGNDTETKMKLRFGRIVTVSERRGKVLYCSGSKRCVNFYPRASASITKCLL